jgi:lipopolysaccharide transport system ATP-binding protein
MSSTAIRAEHVSKRYRLGLRDELPDSMVGSCLQWAKSPLRNWRRLRSLSRFDEVESPDVLWALKDVSFEIQRGEVVGFIGRNGAGKSTLLKILSRITDPTGGQLEIHGRVSSLLEVGTGFHPELTGRENVYLNGTILGMKKREIDRKFDEIVEFSGVSKFIDTPVKRYSTGMMVRLAFAVAAHLEPEILIVDEVLAVGDADFQRKSIGKMQDVASGHGRTVLFVSHNMGSIEKLCERVAVLEQGALVVMSDAKTGVREYLKRTAAIAAKQDIRDLPRTGEGKIRLTSFRMQDNTGEEITAVMTGQDFSICLGFEVNKKQIRQKVSVGLSLHTLNGDCLFNIYTYHTGDDFTEIEGEGEFRCNIRRLPINAGRYIIYARVLVGETESDFPKEPVGYVEVEPGDFYGTGKLTTDRGYIPFLVDANWDCTSNALKTLEPMT